MKKQKQKIKFRKNIINRNLRLGIFIVIGLLIALSAYSAIGAYQQPTTKEETFTVPAVAYTHSGTYDFLAYLVDNSLYGNNTVLEPGQATIFKKLIDHVNASFTYRFQANQLATVQGTYKLEAEIQTSLWSKTYTITPETSFEGTGYITTNFELNTNVYQEIVNQIAEETGVVVTAPVLNLKATVLTTAETASGEISEAFTPEIQISLSGNTLEFEGDLITKQQGAIKTTETITTNIDTSQQRNIWTIATTLFSAIFIVFAFFTTAEIEQRTPAEKMLRKIQKKYGEWIVEAEEQPPTGIAKTISMKSFDDLIKISEEIGKPVVHYKTTTVNPGTIHTFYVFDEEIYYKHVLPTDETITTMAKCPNCGNKIECEGTLGKTVRVTCPSCDNEGKVILTKTSGLNPFKKLFKTEISSK